MELFKYSSPYISIHHLRDQTPDASSFDMHAHVRYELYYFVSGKGEYFVEGAKYRLEPGCILLMHPGETHQLLISDEEPYERIMIHFSDQLIDLVTPQKELFHILAERPTGVGNYYPADHLNQEMIRQCFRELARQLNSGLYREKYQLQLVLFTYCMPIFLDMQHYYLKEGKNVKIQNDGPINAIIAYINEHLAEDISLDRLSKEFFISKSNLNLKFKKATGTTVWDYILTKRLMNAHIKIMNGKSVRTVFQESGFHDYSSFYRRYVRKFGVSPAKSRSTLG